MFKVGERIRQTTECSGCWAGDICIIHRGSSGLMAIPIGIRGDELADSINHDNYCHCQEYWKLLPPINRQVDFLISLTH